jgi:V8-like Glu-specific endopeptidase
MERATRTRRAAVVAAAMTAAAGVILMVAAAGRPAAANASANPASSATPTPTVSPTPTPSPTPSPSTSPNSPPVASPFHGTNAVGALFITNKAGKFQHFCTGAVVRSPQEDLVITAAHCVWGKTLGPKGKVIFAPGYHSGDFPKGRWLVMSAIFDSKWKKDRDPNDDVAFLVVGRNGHKIQKATGAETLETNATMPQKVQVIGYPDRISRPIRCNGAARLLLHRRYLRQLVFDCGGFTGGTSGGPFLMRVSKTTGAGDVIGVIGGFERGGDSPSVSYSSQFLANVADLYKKATK